MCGDEMQTMAPTQTSVHVIQFTWAFFVIAPILFFVIIYVVYRRRNEATMANAQYDDDWLNS